MHVSVHVAAPACSKKYSEQDEGGGPFPQSRPRVHVGGPSWGRTRLWRYWSCEGPLEDNLTPVRHNQKAPAPPDTSCQERQTADVSTDPGRARTCCYRTRVQRDPPDPHNL